MAPRKPSKPKTSAELKQQLEAARAQLALLEQRAYAEELSELIKTTSIAADFARIQASVKNINPTAILQAIGAVVGIKRLSVTQTAPPKRAPADPNKPKKPRAKKAVATS